MADRVKGLTIEINGDVTPLNKALASTNKEIRTTQTALKDVEKLLKLDPKNTQLLEQRQRLLAKAVGETKTKLETLKQAEAQAQEQFQQGKISQEQYEALQREIAATEQELEKLEKAAANSNARVQKISAVTEQLSKSAQEFANKTRAISTAAAGVVAGLAGAAYEAVTLSDDLNTLAKQTGFSTSELQKMQYAADRIDVSMEDMTGAAAKLKKNMASTSSSVVDAFGKLGVSVRDANGEMRNSTTVFWEAVAALSRVGNETERDQLAMTLFGKGADSLAGIIDDGGAAFRAYGDEAERAGLILSQQTLDGLNAVNDQLDTVKAQAKAIIALNGAKVVKAFLPVIQSAANGAGEFAQKLANVDTKTIKTVASVAALVAGVSPIAKLVSGVSGAVSTLIPLVTKLLPLIAANPWLAVGAAVAALAVGIKAVSDAAKTDKDRLSGLNSAAAELKKTIAGANTTFEAEKTQIIGTYTAAKTLTDRLAVLESQTKRTRAEEYERKKIVEQLNALYPQLNLQIDNNTGRLNKNVSEIRNQIAALKDAALQQALQKKYTAYLEAMAAAQEEVWDNQIKLKKIQAEYNAAVADAEKKTQAYNKALAAQNAITDEGSVAWADAETAVRAAKAEMEASKAKVTALAYEQNKLNTAIKNGEATMQSYADEYQTALRVIGKSLENEGNSAGQQWANGLIKGMQARKPYVTSTAADISSSVVKTSKSIMQIASPSKVAKEQGGYWDEGLAIGLRQGGKVVEDAAAEVSQLVIDSAPSVTNNTTNNSTNMGGVYVTVNASPGQSAEDIAEVVMDRIQRAVVREAAAF